MKKQAEEWLNAATDDLKVIEKIIDDETLSNKKLGLLINFNTELIKNGIKRVVNDL